MTSLLGFERVKDSRIQKIIEEFPQFEEVVTATLGSLIILSKINRSEGETQASLAPELVQLRDQVNRVLYNSLLSFHQHQAAASFFDLNGFKEGYTILKPSLLFQSLGTSFELAAKNGEPPVDNAPLVDDKEAMIDKILTRTLHVGEEGLSWYFLERQANSWTSDLLNEVIRVMGAQSSLFFDAIAPQIDELAQVFAPYNQQAYAFFQMEAATEGEKLNLPPYSERRSYTHLYVGTVARARAGKNTINTFLQKYGFKSESLSTILKWMLAATDNSGPYSREVLIEQGHNFKNNLGGGVLIEGLEQSFAVPGKPELLLFDGLRNEAEWLAIKKLAEAQGGKAILISMETADYSGIPEAEALELDQEIRFGRALKAGESKDPKSRAEFESWRDTDDKERVGIDQTAQHATHVIYNLDNNEGDTLSQLELLALELKLSLK